MGFIITGSVFETNQGIIDSIYGRIESFSCHRILGVLNVQLDLYKERKNLNIETEYPIKHYVLSNIIGSIKKNEEEITYPSTFIIPLTSSITVDIPVYDTKIVSESFNYYDFDENGDVVEKTKWEYSSQSLLIGTEKKEQNIVDKELLTGNVFPFMYNFIVKKYKEIFGENNIINF